jgi:hypothetical protein
LEFGVEEIKAQGTRLKAQTPSEPLSVVEPCVLSLVP